MVARPPGPVVAFALLVVLAAAGATGAVAPAAPAAQATPQPLEAQETPSPPAVDNTVTRVELAADGSARWTVTIRTRLDTQSAVEEYEAFQARFRENTSRFLGPFESRITAVVGGAADATGREMAADAFAAETHVQEVPRRWGIVSYSFTWEGFAAVEDGAVVAGDAFDGGFFLAANDTLTVVAPTGYAISRVEPAPTERGDRTVAWTGREDFPDGRPLVRAEPAGAAGGQNSPGGSRFLSDRTLIGAGAVLLALLGGLAATAYRRRSAGTTSGSGEVTLTTDEERVLEFLQSRGGRVQQTAVVEAFDWSTSKTSRLLSRMAEEGSIEKLQLGRENLVRLADEEDGD